MAGVEQVSSGYEDEARAETLVRGGSAPIECLERSLGQLYLIRHGEVLWNREKPAYCGITDLDLNAEGVRQAGCLAERLASVPLAAVYSSDLRRARDTAAAIAARHGLEPIADPALREVNYGDWEGVSEEEVRERWPEVYRAWRNDAESIRIPGGETFGELRDRFLGGVTRILAQFPDQPVAIVAHKAANRVFICSILGLSPSQYRRIGQDNTAINVLDYTEGRWRIDLVNDVCHLK